MLEAAMTCPAPTHLNLTRPAFALILVCWVALTASAQPGYILDGGDDVVIFEDTNAWIMEIEIANNGDMYALCQFDGDSYFDPFAIYRSTNSGETWDLWADFPSTAPGTYYHAPSILVADGSEPRIFLVYANNPGGPYHTDIHVAWSPLGLEVGDFSADTIVYTDPDGVATPSLASDVESFDVYFLYLAFTTVDDPYGHDIYFSRSINQGDSWETPYEIGGISLDDRYYTYPTVTYGFGGYVHVVWYLDFVGEHEFDASIRYRRASNYGSGGIASWDGIRSLSPHDNDMNEIRPSIAASNYSNDVVITYTRKDDNPPGYYDGLGIISSTDQGENFSAETLFGEAYISVGTILEHTETNRWLFHTARAGNWGYYAAPVADPTSWGDMVTFNDSPFSTGLDDMALDPTHDNQVAVVGMRAIAGEAEKFCFDAAWRDGPGYPNYEDGFPIDLDDAPKSDPGLVDLNGDGDLEILFADSAHRLQAIQSDGTPLPGWPVVLDTLVSPSPIAVGELLGDGQLYVVAGTISGKVYAFHADGTLADGWPWDSGVDAPIYVALGALGGPYLRAVVACFNSEVRFLDYEGSFYPGAVGRSFPGKTISNAPAIGDIDGDGISEVVLAASNTVYGFEMKSAAFEFTNEMSPTITTGICLGDFDFDDSMEIVVGLFDGTIHLFDGTGGYFPGAWPVSALDSYVTGIAIAAMRGSGEPEIVVTGRSWQVNALYHDGSVLSGWPNETTTGWYIYGDPIIGTIDIGSPDVILGVRDKFAWSWSNFGNVNPGWPKWLDETCQHAAAYGDIDLDGNAEIVFLTASKLHMVDVGVPVDSPGFIWPMAGYDPERTSCANCIVDLSAADDPEPAVSRLRFSAPSPNPINNSARFSYAIPVRAVVELNIYDVGGRRVTTVQRSEQQAGDHLIAWDGLDCSGQPVASGQYLATLRVVGSGLKQTLTRKVTVLR